MPSVTDFVPAMLENVRPNLPILIERSTTLIGIIKKAADTHRVSAYTAASGAIGSFRVPFVKWVGGTYGAVNMDGGDMGAGTGPALSNFTLSSFATRIAFAFTAREKNATETSEQAALNAFKFLLGNGIKEFQAQENIVLIGDSTGVVATGSGVGTPTSPNPVYAMEPNIGVQRLKQGAWYDVYDTTLATKRTAAPIQCTYINWAAKTATFTGTVTTPANTDVIAYPGLAATLAAGSYKNGIGVFNSTATTGTTLGVDRAVVSEIISPGVNAAGGTVVPEFFMQVRDQLTQRRDEDALKGILGITHLSQRAALYKVGVVLSEWQRTSNDSTIPDLVPGKLGLETTIQVAGITHYISKHQDRTRIDWIIPKNWGRAMIKEYDWYTTPEGKRFFEKHTQSTANVASGFDFFVVGDENYYCIDPGATGVISSLALPSGY